LCNVDYIIPGNDDSIRAVQLYVETVATAILEAKAAQLDMSAKSDEFVEETASAAE
jgi:small subunit ribosomal protein S2